MKFLVTFKPMVINLPDQTKEQYLESFGTENFLDAVEQDFEQAPDYIFELLEIDSVYDLP